MNTSSMGNVTGYLFVFHTQLSIAHRFLAIRVLRNAVFPKFDVVGPMGAAMLKLDTSCTYSFSLGLMRSTNHVMSTFVVSRRFRPLCYMVDTFKVNSRSKVMVGREQLEVESFPNP